MIGLHWIISLVLVGLGIILFFYLASRKKYRDPSAAQNYEKIRNKLTVREPEKKKEPEYEYSGGIGFLSNIIGGFIVFFVGTSLVPEISKQVAHASMVGNVTGATDTLLGLTTVFFTLAVAVSALGICYLGLRNSGVV